MADAEGVQAGDTGRRRSEVLRGSGSACGLGAREPETRATVLQLVDACAQVYNSILGNAAKQQAQRAGAVHVCTQKQTVQLALQQDKRAFGPAAKATARRVRMLADSLCKGLAVVTVSTCAWACRRTVGSVAVLELEPCAGPIRRRAFRLKMQINSFPFTLGATPVRDDLTDS